jgi:hypothetical protein
VFVEPFFIEMLNEMEKDKNDVNVTSVLQADLNQFVYYRSEELHLQVQDRLGRRWKVVWTRSRSRRLAGQGLGLSGDFQMENALDSFLTFQEISFWILLWLCFLKT